MERYDYLEQITSDVKEAILARYDMKKITVELEDRESFEQDLYNRLRIDDSVTGNGRGTYTFNTYEDEECLCPNLDLLGEALEEFGCSPDYMSTEGPEACDVTIRCYMLPRAISAALDELEEEIEDADDADED